MSRTVTVTVDDADPIYNDIVRLLAKRTDTSTKPRVNLASLQASGVSPSISFAETETQCVWDHLGPVSKEFVRSVAHWCDTNKSLEFTVEDIATEMLKTKWDIRAYNRNVARASKKEGAQLWTTKWDHAARSMRFRIASQVHLEAMLSMI